MEHKLASPATSAISPLLGGFVALSAWLTCAAVAPSKPAHPVTAAAMVPFANDARGPRNVSFDRNEAAISAGIVASVERTLEASGGELLRGETHFTLRDSSTLRVSENVRIDGFGRLDRAEVSLSYEGGFAPAPERVLRATLDAGGGVLSVTRVNGRTDTRSVPNALPWVYLPVVLDSRERLCTPVAARVALRAAEVSHFALQLAGYEVEHSISGEQLEERLANGKRVILGENTATFGAGGDLLALDVNVLGLRIRPQR